MHGIISCRETVYNEYSAFDELYDPCEVYLTGEELHRL
jgi:hypothetical protein